MWTFVCKRDIAARDHMLRHFWCQFRIRLRARCASGEEGSGGCGGGRSGSTPLEGLEIEPQRRCGGCPGRWLTRIRGTIPLVHSASTARSNPRLIENHKKRNSAHLPTPLSLEVSTVTLNTTPPRCESAPFVTRLLRTLSDISGFVLGSARPRHSILSLCWTKTLAT